MGQRSPIIGRESVGGSVKEPHARALSERGELNPSPVARSQKLLAWGGAGSGQQEEALVIPEDCR